MSTNTFRRASRFFKNNSLRLMEAFFNRHDGAPHSVSFESLEGRQMLAGDVILTLTQGKSVTVNSPSSVTTFTLTGPGTGVLTVTELNELVSLNIVGSAANTNLRITTTTNTKTNSIGSITIGAEGDSTTDSIGSINAAGLSVTKAIHVEGSASAITLDTLQGDLHIHKAGAVKTTLKVNQLSGSDISSSGSLASLTVGSKGIDQATINAVSIGSVSSAGNADHFKIIAQNQLGAMTFKGNLLDTEIRLTGLPSRAQTGLSSITVSGNTTDLFINAVSANNQVGSLKLGNTVTNVDLNIAGILSGLSGGAAVNLNVDAGNLKNFSFTGNVQDLNLSASALGSFTTRGSLTDAEFLILSNAVRDTTVVGPITISGPAANISVLSPNAFANFGSLNLGSSLTEALFNISGDIASVKSGAIDELILTSNGKIGSLSVAGNFTDSAIDTYLLGATKVSGALSKVGITVNSHEFPLPSASIKSLASLSVTGPASNLLISASGANSFIGALNFAQGLSNASFNINGSISSIASKGSIQSLVSKTVELNALKITGDIADSSITSFAVGPVTISGNVTGVGLNLHPTDSSDNFKALASLSIGGSVAGMDLNATGKNSNIGAISITGDSVGFSAFVNGNVARLAAKSFDITSSVDILGKLSSLSTSKAGHLNGGFSAGSIGAISIGGDFLGSVAAITNAGIGAVNVTGDINDAVLRSQGSIASVSANAILQSTILSGFDNSEPLPTALPATASGFNNSKASINVITVKSTGSAASFVDSIVAGVKIGNVSLKVVETNNSGSVFGLAAAAQLGPVSRTGAAIVQKITTPAQSQQIGDFALRILTPVVV